MLLNTIETIKILLGNAVDHERKNVEDLKNSFAKKYGYNWNDKITKEEEEELIEKQRKLIEIEDIQNDFVSHDWR